VDVATVFRVPCDIRGLTHTLVSSYKYTFSTPGAVIIVSRKGFIAVSVLTNRIINRADVEINLDYAFSSRTRPYMARPPWQDVDIDGLFA
jgi:hypothetical protein